MILWKWGMLLALTCIRVGSGKLNNCYSRYNTHCLSSLLRTCLYELQHPTCDSFQSRPVLPLSPVLSAGTPRLCKWYCPVAWSKTSIAGEQLSQRKCLKTANNLDVQFGESQLAAVHKDLCLLWLWLISQIHPQNQSFKVSKAPGCIQAVTVLLGHWGINASNLTLL